MLGRKSCFGEGVRFLAQKVVIVWLHISSLASVATNGIYIGNMQTQICIQ